MNKKRIVKVETRVVMHTTTAMFRNDGSSNFQILSEMNCSLELQHRRAESSKSLHCLPQLLPGQECRRVSESLPISNMTLVGKIQDLLHNLTMQHSLSF